MLEIFQTSILLVLSITVFMLVFAYFKDMSTKRELYEDFNENIRHFVDILNEYIKCEPKRFKENSGYSEQDSKSESNVERQNTQTMDAGQQPEDFANIVSKRTKTAVNFGEDV